MQELWRHRVKEALKAPIQGRVFSAFNTNVDVIVHVTPAKMAKWMKNWDLAKLEELSLGDIDAVSTPDEFFAVLLDRLSKGKSFHIVLHGQGILSWLDETIDARQDSMGGQAGIIANQMAHLGAESICYTPLLSDKQANMFHPGVKTPRATDRGLELVPTRLAARPGTTKINWILEYAKDEEFTFGERSISTPRANRVILATRPREAVMGFPPDLVPHLPQLGSQIDLAFMAGYHYADRTLPDGRSFDQYLADTQRDLSLLRRGNPSLRIHYEYVPVRLEELEKDLLEGICREVHSFGVNETEIKRVLKNLGFAKEYKEIQSHERAYSLYQGALCLLRHLRLERLHLHNLGYYVVVLAKPYPVPVKRVRRACLYASAVNAVKAKYGGYVSLENLQEAGDWALSGIGFEQLASFHKELKKQDPSIDDGLFKEGILERDDHYVLLVPAHIIPDPVSTVGMGDTISSSSYLAELGDGLG
ncbi:MAG: ADP-dependent glucokinase/phosphofructokinase [Limnochordia bacterium]